MVWDVGEGGGEDGVFGWVEGWRSFVLVGMVRAATFRKEAQSNMRWVPQECVQWPHDNHRSCSSSHLCSDILGSSPNLEGKFETLTLILSGAVELPRQFSEYDLVLQRCINGTAAANV